ncbi:hypothetical protein CEXT_654221 [Caerostris extrusa]|uniref:Uncharacterized protein n=1 Tax=Caerostris extrusa TaxID=172846 RepID=A0AAV4Y0E4_CAEEX|nr:hypothetical protein CEXT_654221 [Caerostris extrusa]
MTCSPKLPWFLHQKKTRKHPQNLSFYGATTDRPSYRKKNEEGKGEEEHPLPTPKNSLRVRTPPLVMRNLLIMSAASQRRHYLRERTAAIFSEHICNHAQ